MKGVCSGSKFSPSSESMGQSCSEPGSDCQAPGYPCSGRGNVCDYLLCKPPSWRRKKKGGENGRERQFRQGLCVCVCTGRRDYAHAFLCMCIMCVCVLWLCVYSVFWWRNVLWYTWQQGGNCLCLDKLAWLLSLCLQNVQEQEKIKTLLIIISICGMHFSREGDFYLKTLVRGLRPTQCYCIFQQQTRPQGGMTWRIVEDETNYKTEQNQ